MAGKPQKFKFFKTRGRRVLRIISLVFMFLLVFYLGYFVYDIFDVGGIWDWVGDVLALFGIFLVVILAALGVVWLMTLVRKHRG